MTINLADNNPRVVYSVAQGVTQTVFAVPFEFFEDGDVNVYVDGTLKAEGTDYTLTGGEGATGTLTFVAAGPGETQQVTGATGGSTVVLVRRIAIERTTDFQSGQDINRSALNEQLDVLTALVADMNDRWDRAVHLNDFDTGQVNFVLPAKEQRIGNYFAFDANGDPVMTSGTTSTIIVSAFAETLLDDNTASDMLTTLGLTATAAELNILDGVTSSTAEINKLDGVTWTLTDLNTITAAGKALLDDADAAAQRTTLGLGNIATTDLIDEDSMATDSATRAPSQQSVKAYVDAGDANQIGVGQTWQTVTRSANTSYQNTTGKPIMVAITGNFNGAFAEVSTDNSTWVAIWQPGNNQQNTASFIVPNNHYYRVGSGGGGSLTLWRELR